MKIRIRIPALTYILAESEVTNLLIALAAYVYKNRFQKSKLA